MNNKSAAVTDPVFFYFFFLFLQILSHLVPHQLLSVQHETYLNSGTQPLRRVRVVEVKERN